MEENKNKTQLMAANVSDDRDDEIEINIGHVFATHFWTMLLVALALALASAGVTRFLISPTYTSSSMMLVVTKETTLTSIADLQIGSSLTNDYQVLIESRPVLQKVVKDLNLDMDYKELKNHLSVSNPTDTRILQIDATSSSPELARKITNDVARVSSAYIADRMEVTAPKIIETGELPTRQTSPSMTKNVAIAFLVGFILAFAVACVNDVMNDAIESEEDIQKYLGIPVLASVPNKDLEKEADKKNRKRRKKASR